MGKRITAESAPGSNEARLFYKNLGMKKFIWYCSLHGATDYYTSSGACRKCTNERRDPLAQAKYWAENKDKYKDRKK